MPKSYQSGSAKYVIAQLIDAIEGAFQQVGLNVYEGAAALKQYIDANYPFVEASLSREALNHFFLQADENDTAQASDFISLTLAFPAIAEQLILNSVQETASQLPAPPVGRKTVLTPGGWPTSDSPSLLRHPHEVGAPHLASEMWALTWRRFLFAAVHSDSICTVPSVPLA